MIVCACLMVVAWARARAQEAEVPQGGRDEAAVPLEVLLEILEAEGWIVTGQIVRPDLREEGHPPQFGDVHQEALHEGPLELLLNVLEV